MSKIKEYFFFILIFLIGFIVANKGLDLFRGENRSWSEIILSSSFVVFILLIAKIFGFLDKKNKSTD